SHFIERQQTAPLAQRVGFDGGIGTIQTGHDAGQDGTVTPCERNIACYIVGHAMMGESGVFRRTVRATNDSTAVPLSPFLVSTDRTLGEASPRRGLRKKSSDEQIRISLPAKTASAPCSRPDWLPRRSQTHRGTLPRKGKLLCGEFPKCTFLAVDGDALLQPKSQH